MSTLESTTRLGGVTASFDEMIKRFGVVTVMNAKVFRKPLSDMVPDYKNKKVHKIVEELKQYAVENPEEIAFIDSLKIANINMEGPDKTVTGGQYANPLIKFGKSATIEMQDALGNSEVLEAFGICVNETFSTLASGSQKAVHFTEDFAGPITVLGESFFIQQKTGEQVPVEILLYQVLPDSIMNLTQDSEGDATVFDLNGSLLTTTITIGDVNGADLKKGVFYSVIPVLPAGGFTVTYKPATGESSKVDTLVLDQLNKKYGATDAQGKYKVPVLNDYTINKDEAAAGSGTVVEGGTETLKENTTYYLKKA